MNEYEYMDQIARTQHGSIDRYQNVKSLEMVAIKTVVTGRSDSGEVKSPVVKVMAEMEVAVYEKLASVGGHVNILPLYQKFWTKNALHLVLPYCPRGDLFSRVNQLGGLTPLRYKLYFCQIARGVQTLHQLGFAHMDLSLENILLDHQDHCKIFDFGLATFVDKPSCHIVGKPFYMAPEVYDGEIYDPGKCDLWSMGIMLFIMITGFPIFETPSSSDTRFLFLEEYGVSKLLQRWGFTSIPKPVVHVLENLLRIDPKQRKLLPDIECWMPAQCFSPCIKNGTSEPPLRANDMKTHRSIPRKIKHLFFKK